MDCKSRGGLSTKIHATVDGLGNPLRVLLTGEQPRSSEYDQSQALIEGYRAECVLGDKGDDSDELTRAIKMSGAEPMLALEKQKIRNATWWNDFFRKQSTSVASLPAMSG